MLLFDHQPIRAIVCDIEGHHHRHRLREGGAVSLCRTAAWNPLWLTSPTLPKGRPSSNRVRTEVDDPHLTMAEATAQLLAWARADQKVTPLKAVQGMIWDEGYRTGAYTSHMYDDAVANLEKWHRHGVPLYILFLWLHCGSEVAVSATPLPETSPPGSRATSTPPPAPR